MAKQKKERKNKHTHSVRYIKTKLMRLKIENNGKSTFSNVQMQTQVRSIHTGCECCAAHTDCNNNTTPHEKKAPSKIHAKSHGQCARTREIKHTRFEKRNSWKECDADDYFRSVTRLVRCCCCCVFFSIRFLHFFLYLMLIILAVRWLGKSTLIAHVRW